MSLVSESQDLRTQVCLHLNFGQIYGAHGWSSVQRRGVRPRCCEATDLVELYFALGVLLSVEVAAEMVEDGATAAPRVFVLVPGSVLHAAIVRRTQQRLVVHVTQRPLHI